MSAGNFYTLTLVGLDGSSNVVVGTNQVFPAADPVWTDIFSTGGYSTIQTALASDDDAALGAAIKTPQDNGTSYGMAFGPGTPPLLPTTGTFSLYTFVSDTAAPTLGGAGAFAVPEPATAVVMVLPALWTLAWRKRRG
jgi:hypothetical protein